MIIKIKVKPNSGKQELTKNNDEYQAYLKSSPEKNKANIELIKLLEKYFNSKIKIKSGKNSKIKIIEVKNGN